MSRSYIWTGLIIASSIVFALVLAEVLLLAMGFRPWAYIAFSNEPRLHTADDVLGWKNKQGSYTIPPYAPAGSEIEVTFLEDGSRLTGSNPAAAGNNVLVVGGSYTQGWAISDHETYAWKIQSAHPGITLKNFGTGAYSTYQSLLVLEKTLPETRPPATVIYGFIDHHETRNVAPALWLSALSRASGRGHVHVPYATLDEHGQLLRHEPETHAAFPFRQSLASVALLEAGYMELKTRKRGRQKTDVTRSLLVEMKKLTEKYGANLHVIILEMDDAQKQSYIDFMDRNDISATDCAYPITGEYRVPGEGHPNEILNQKWSDCIMEAVNLGNG